MKRNLYEDQRNLEDDQQNFGGLVEFFPVNQSSFEQNVFQ